MRISIHAPRTGSDLGRESVRAFRLHFNPRSPHGERQISIRKIWTGCYFNPRSPHGERLQMVNATSRRKLISIHAPRTGSDTLKSVCYGRIYYFNPRSPHGERHAAGFEPCRILVFQSTLPARGATHLRKSAPASPGFQSTLPARGATIPSKSVGSTSVDFNPRSPHGERLRSPMERINRRRFQSTLPARGATRCGRRTRRARGYFNPRSPHGERRARSRRSADLLQHFNPRSPHGERLHTSTI